MIFDQELCFFDGQAITVSAASDAKDLSLVAPNIGKGTPLFVKAQVDEDFATLTSVSIAIQDSDDDSTFTTVSETGAIPVADLVAGYEFPQLKVPNKHGRYLRLYATVVGTTGTAGKITAYIDRA